ncbi:MAG: hypothetical protein HY586_05150 [Candidatus Omnitrophica bacterium]|nr:hypothetical protein [Candidatus Omnitrophota bacterium]
MKIFGIDLEKLPRIKFSDPREARFVQITGGFITICFLLGIFPIAYQMFQTASKIASIKHQSRTAGEKIRSLPLLKIKQKSYLDQAADLEKQCYDREHISELISTVSEMAKEAGVVILSSKQFDYKPEQPPAAGENKIADLLLANSYYRPVFFRFILEAPYHHLGKFINQMETHEKLMRVFAMTVERDTEKASAAKLKIELDLMALEKTEQGAVAQK